MALNFPNSPSLNDEYSFGNKTWIWNGSAWKLKSAGAINNTPIGNVVASTGGFTTITAGNIILGNVGEQRFNDADGTHYVGWKAPNTVTTSLVWALPNTDGAAGQFMKTDGFGNLSWGTASGGGGGGYFNSTLTAFPGSTGNVDYGDGETYVGESATTDAFGISIINTFSVADPLGSLVGPHDLGVLT